MMMILHDVLYDPTSIALQMQGISITEELPVLGVYMQTSYTASAPLHVHNTPSLQMNWMNEHHSGVLSKQSITTSA